MTNHSINITADGATDTSTPDRSTTQVNTNMGEAVRQPSAPQAPLGEGVNTTEGRATVVNRMDGTTIVQMPSGLEMTQAEAEKLGLLNVDQTTPQEAPKVDEENSLEKPSEHPTVDAAELEAHATELNTMGDALTAAGIDEMDGLTRAVEGLATEGLAPEDVTAALDARFGEEGTDAIINNGFHHAQAITADMLEAAGINISTIDANRAAALATMMDNNIPSIVQALTGNRQPLQSLITQFKLGDFK